MTNQQVINFLNQARKILLADKSWIESAIKPINEAFDMAISALEKQDVPDTNVGDTVSKKAVELALLEKGQASKRYKLGEIWELNFDEIREALATVPSAQPERKKGHWETYVISMIDGEGCRCSECGSEGVPHWVSCPNCDARMEVKNERPRND